MTANNYPTLTQVQLDAIVASMDDDLRERLSSTQEWQHPGEYLTAYLAADPEFPIHQFSTSSEVSAMSRAEIAAELLRGVPTESRDDHEVIAAAIRAGQAWDIVLAMGETQRWPETYAWIKATATLRPAR